MGELVRRSGDLVRTFNDSNVLIKPAGDIEKFNLLELEQGSPEIYLGTDVFIGEYGVASYVLVVPRPLDRPTYFIAAEGPAGNWSEEELKLCHPDIYEDPIRRAHFLDTEQGFGAVRVVSAPEVVRAKLGSDQFLGPAIVDKCSLEGIVPAEFDEERGLDIYYSLGIENLERFQRSINRVEKAVGMNDYDTLRTYASWHSWRMYQPVMAEFTDAAVTTVAKFDQALGLLGSDLPRQIRLDKGKV